MPDGLVTGHGSVWVARQASGDVLRIDPTNGRIVARIPIGRAQATDTEGHLPSNLTVGENAVWALNSAEGTAYWIDATTNSVAGSVHLGSVPLALVQSAGSVWVADYREGTVARIDVATHQVLGKPTNIGWLPTAILPHQGSVWVLRCGTENRLFRIDPGTGTTVGKPIRLGPSPGVITREVAIGAGSFWAFAQPSVVQRIDPTSGALLASIEVPTQVSGIAFGHDRLWLCDRSGYISKIDPATNRFEGDPIPAGLSLSRIYAADDALWVADELAGSLIKVPYK
jgi:DNA-binding beta-propeller fold protein YncE